MGGKPSVFAGHVFTVCNYRIDGGSNVHHQVYDKTDSSYAIYNMNYKNTITGTCVDDLWCTTDNACDVRICLGDCDGSSDYQKMLNNMNKDYVYVFDEDYIIKSDKSGFTLHEFSVSNALTGAKDDITLHVGVNEPYANTYKGIAEAETFLTALNDVTTQEMTVAAGQSRTVTCYSLDDSYCEVEIYDYDGNLIESFHGTDSTGTYTYNGTRRRGLEDDRNNTNNDNTIIKTPNSDDNTGVVNMEIPVPNHLRGNSAPN